MAKAKNWSDLTTAQQNAIEKAYKAGKEPGEIAPKYGLKPKQVSDQAYRTDWPKPKKTARRAEISASVSNCIAALAVALAPSLSFRNKRRSHRGRLFCARMPCF